MPGTSTVLIKAVHSRDIGVQAGAARGLLAPLLSFIFIPPSHRLCLKLWMFTSTHYRTDGSSGVPEQWGEEKQLVQTVSIKDSLQSKSKIKRHLRNFNVSPQGMENKLLSAGVSVLNVKAVGAQSNDDISQEWQNSVSCAKSRLVSSN